MNLKKILLHHEFKKLLQKKITLKNFPHHEFKKILLHHEFKKLLQKKFTLKKFFTT